ncbi:MAG: transporter [Elusimicrobia bacterium]|nr:transporter [Elusimicrobiota bacterium]
MNPFLRIVARCVCAGLVLAVFPSLGRALDQEDQLLQEFLIAESVHPQLAGRAQLTVGADHGEDDNFVTGRLPLLVEYGLTDEWQIDAEVPYLYLDPEGGNREYGLGDTQVGVFYTLWDRLDPYTVSFRARQVFPTGDEDEGLGDDEYTFRPSIITARAFGAGQLHGAVTANISDETDFLYSLAGVYPLTNWRFAAELEGTNEADGRWRIAPGVFYKPTSLFEAGIGVPFGLTSETPDLGVVVKLSTLFQ